MKNIRLHQREESEGNVGAISCNKERENRHARDSSGTWVFTIFLEYFLFLHFPTSFDPNGVTEKCPCTAMEIAAMSGNATAFHLLAPHCKDELNK